MEKTASQKKQRILQGLLKPLVSSKSVKLGSSDFVVYNKFSGPTPKLRSALQRKISTAITTQGPDYLYKIMNLFLYMPIISPKREFINVDFFSLL